MKNKSRVSNKEKQRRKKITKIDKTTVMLIVFLVMILLFKLFSCVIMYFSKSFAVFYIKNILNTINGVLFFLFSLIPYSSYLFMLLYFALFLFLIIKQTKLVNNKEDDVKLLNKKYNLYERIAYIFVFFLLFSLVSNMQISHMPLMDEDLFPKTRNKTYTVRDLDNINKYYSNRIDYYAKNMVRGLGNRIEFTGDYNKQAVRDLKKSSSIMPLLEGIYPIRSDNLNTVLKMLVGSNTMGLTHLYSTYFDYDMDPTTIINTMEHEYCHTKGYLRENETTMCSYIAGINSDNDVSVYSAYLEAFGRTIRAYLDIYPETAYPILDKVASKCMLNDYPELCEIYSKMGDKYIPGAYELYAKTYSLKNYKGNADELIESLKILSDGGYILKSIFENKEISLEEIRDEINKGKDDWIYIDGKLTSKKFKQVKEAFKNDKLYMSIYQINYTEEESDDLKKDPFKYYLAPFPQDYDKIINNSNKMVVDYTYERVTRLLFEYHEKYGY